MVHFGKFPKRMLKNKNGFSSFLLTKYFVLIHSVRFSGVTIKTTLQTVRKINKFLSSQKFDCCSG